MKPIHSFAVIFFVWFFSGCSADESLPIPAPPATECSQSNGSVAWKVEQNSYCSNQELYASDQGVGVVINAITKTGVNITMIIDSLTPGTYPMTTLQNGLLYMDQLGQTWTMEIGSTGTLQVLSHDVANKRLKAAFTCTAQNGLGNTIQIRDGKIDVVYSE